MGADAGFSPSLNVRVFQQYRRIADIPDRCRERPRSIRMANARDRPAKPEPCAATPRRPALEGRSGPEGYDFEGRRRASSPASSAWRRVFVLANTAFNWVRAVSRLTPTEAAAESIPTPEASLVASLASAAVRPKAAHKFFELGRSGDLRSVRRRIRRPELNKSLPNAVTGIASTKSHGASSRSTTIGG